MLPVQLRPHLRSACHSQSVSSLSSAGVRLRFTSIPGCFLSFLDRYPDLYLFVRYLSLVRPKPAPAPPRSFI